MRNTFTAVIFAAAVAALITLLSAPSNEVRAMPVPMPLPWPQTAPVAIVECAPVAWPYHRCDGTRFGNPNARLVTTDRIAG
jgi:hypothetical protein